MYQKYLNIVTTTVTIEKGRCKEFLTKYLQLNMKMNKDMKTLKWLAGVNLALIVIIFLVVLSINTKLGDGASVGAVKAPSAAAPSPSPTVDFEDLIDDTDYIKGDENAPVTIIEWSDFECPFCVRFYDQTLSSIDEKYIQTGKVRLVYKDFPLSFHQQAQKAAEAAQCAGDQGKYYEMHDMLFESGVSGGVASFKAYATNLGLNSAQFNNCLDSGKYYDEVQDDMKQGAAAGVRGTPGFLVNGQLVSGAQPFSVFEQVIEAALA